MKKFKKIEFGKISSQDIIRYDNLVVKFFRTSRFETFLVLKKNFCVISILGVFFFLSLFSFVYGFCFVALVIVFTVLVCFLSGLLLYHSFNFANMFFSFFVSFLFVIFFLSFPVFLFSLENGFCFCFLFSFHGPTSRRLFMKVQFSRFFPHNLNIFLRQIPTVLEK